ncbi:hypothetical protein RCL1_003407 [Eukaryota sp. TZLM3-RCL]
MYALRNKWPSCLVLNTDLYNIATRLKQSNGTHTSVDALTSFLSTNGFVFSIFPEVPTQDNANIQRLFFTTPDLIELTQRHSKCLLMDSTYKTNKYGMPLLVTVGETGTGDTFFSSFCFLSNESVDDYTWALANYQSIMQIEPEAIVTDRELALLNAVATIYPRTKQMLCVWHIERNIETKCRKLLPEKLISVFHDDFRVVYLAKTLEDYNSFSSMFIEKWSMNYRELAMYIQNTWFVHKEKFVHYFLGEVRHYGTSTTSRVESAHALLKKTLETSYNDLREVVAKSLLVIQEQLHTISVEKSRQQLFKPVQYLDTELEPLLGLRTYNALDLLNTQLQKAKNMNCGLEVIDSCTQQFTNNYGLPCSHTILSTIENEGSIGGDQIDKHWWLYDDSFQLLSDQTAEDSVTNMGNTDQSILEVVREHLEGTDDFERERLEVAIKIALDQSSTSWQPPVTANVQKKGRPVGSKRTSSKQRDPSAFEVARNKVSEKRLCSTCKEPGHNAATCVRRKK